MISVKCNGSRFTTFITFVILNTRFLLQAEKRKLLYDVVKDTFDRIMGCKDENGVSVALPFINLRLKQP